MPWCVVTRNTGMGKRLLGKIPCMLAAACLATACCFLLLLPADSVLVKVPLVDPAASAYCILVLAVPTAACSGIIAGCAD